MRGLFLIFLAPWATSANITTLSNFSVALAARQATMILAGFSYGVTTITSTALDNDGNPKSRTEFDYVGITSNGQSYGTQFSTVLDVTTFEKTTLTSSYDITVVLPTLYSSYPSTLSSGTNTFRVQSLTTVYTVKESTVMNGPLISMTILTTQTATVAKGTTGFTTRTDILSKPIISTFSVPFTTTTATGTFTVTMDADGPIVTTTSPSSSTPSTLLTRPSLSSSQASTAPSSTSTSPPSTPTSKSSPNKAVIIAVVVSILAVAALLGLGYWFWRRPKVQKAREKEISQPSAVVRMISKPQDAFDQHSPPPPPPQQPTRSDTVTSHQASSDLPSGPYYNYTGTERDDSSHIQPRPHSFRPSYQSYTESDIVPPSRPPRPETVNTDVREFMSASPPESESQDYREYILATQEKEAKERRRLMLEKAEAKRDEELERARRERSAEDLRKQAEDEEKRAKAERAEQLERAKLYQQAMVPPPLNIAKKPSEKKMPYHHEPDESHYGIIVSDGNGGLVDTRPYSPSEYETIVPDSSGSEASIKKRKMPSKNEPVSQSPNRKDIPATTADLSSDHHKYDFHDDDDSDEDKKTRERRQAERQLLTGDTRESIYSQGTSLGWNAYNRGLNLDRSPPPKR